MNLLTVYKEVYGADANPGEEQLNLLSDCLAILPDFLFGCIYDRYVLNKPVTVIAQESERPANLVISWLGHGIHLLKLCCGVIKVN